MTREIESWLTSREYECWRSRAEGLEYIEIARELGIPAPSELFSRGLKRKSAWRGQIPFRAGPRRISRASVPIDPPAPHRKPHPLRNGVNWMRLRRGAAYDGCVLAAANWLLVTDQIPLMLPQAPMKRLRRQCHKVPEA